MLSLFALVYYLLFFLIWALFLKYLFLDFFILFLSLPYLNLLFHIFFWKCLAYFGGFTRMSFCCAFPVILFVISYFHTKFAWGLIVIIFCSSFFHETAWAFRRRPASAAFPDFAELPFVFTLFSAISWLFLSLLSGPSFPLFLLSLSCLILIPLPAFSPRGGGVVVSREGALLVSVRVRGAPSERVIPDPLRSPRLGWTHRTLPFSAPVTNLATEFDSECHVRVLLVSGLSPWQIVWPLLVSVLALVFSGSRGVLGS